MAAFLVSLGYVAAFALVVAAIPARLKYRLFDKVMEKYGVDMED